eukprot:2344608-Rhodomonas_salina.1
MSCLFIRKTGSTLTRCEDQGLHREGAEDTAARMCMHRIPASCRNANSEDGMLRTGATTYDPGHQERIRTAQHVRIGHRIGRMHEHIGVDLGPERVWRRGSLWTCPRRAR